MREYAEHIHTITHALCLIAPKPFNTVEDLITKITKLRMMLEGLKTTNPVLSSFSDLLDEVLSKCLVIIDSLLQVHVLIDSALKTVSNSSLIFDGIDWQIAGKYLKILEDSEDLNDALNRVSEHERVLIVDLVKALKKRGIIDIDIDIYNGGLKVKVVRKRRLKHQVNDENSH